MIGYSVVLILVKLDENNEFSSQTLTLERKKMLSHPRTQRTNRQAEQGLQFDCTELHEYSYTFFANLAKVLEEDMSVHVARLAPHLLKEIQASCCMRTDAAPPRTAAIPNY